MRILLAASLAALMLFAGAAVWYCATIHARLERLISLIDSEQPGYGFDHYANATVHNAEAYAIMATVFTRLEMEDAGTAAANWLLLDGRRVDGIGWGLPFSWDAFGDGTVNPIETVYGVSVALAVRALLDVCKFSGHAQYCSEANEALDYYMQFHTTEEGGGYFWYSDQEHDAHDVYNVSALLAAQYARAGKLSGRADYAEIADRTVRHLWSKRRDDETGVWWPYSRNNSTPNDLVHAVMMVEGLLEYSRHGEQHFPTAGMKRYLKSFLKEDVTKEFGRHTQLPATLLERPARVWGVSALIALLATESHPLAVARLVKSLSQYESSSGRYNLTPDNPETAPIFDAYVALALTTALHDGCVPCKLMLRHM